MIASKLDNERSRTMRIGIDFDYTKIMITRLRVQKVKNRSSQCNFSVTLFKFKIQTKWDQKIRRYVKIRREVGIVKTCSRCQSIVDQLCVQNVNWVVEAR